ncbi:uncharacterized protein LOC105279346 isoform X1 [Ooceraea biroi]|uniref:uncharacterized protein LOC105279346 isoform X1 n=1 Tax=Ooceraea biroi TaxID=2015173 RepID=UPI000F07DE7C|nr:uncharacterized protein LOC105279346 isoform X1 [Ooceraea biroi]
MARNSKRKLAIFAGTSKCLIYAEAKYCASEMPGEIKYYECLKTEYCCAFGCCVSPGLHFHHLWYYWILVIIMFLVCSGGGWWYRYWLQGRYRAAASAIPSRSSNSRSQNSLRNAPCQAQQARITYNSARNTVLLHRMWKGSCSFLRNPSRPQRSTAAPAYNGNATTSTHYQNMNVVLNDTSCPYYQLYGPPPSYETVIAQTRGKIGSPASPATAAEPSSTTRLNHLQPANVIPNPSVPQCFFYCSSPARLVNGGANQCHQADNASEGVPPFAHYSQYCAANGAAIGQNVCVPLEYPEESAGVPAAVPGGFAHQHYPASPQRPPGYPVDVSDVRNAEGHAMLNVNGATDSCVASWCPASDQSALKVHGRVTVPDGGCGMTAAGTHTSSPKSETNGSLEGDAKRSDVLFATVVVPEATRRSFSRERTGYGGSLRLPRRSTAGAIVHRGDGFHRISFRGSSSSQRRVCDSARTTVAESAARDASQLEERAVQADANSSQSNPSNNVILGSFICESTRSPACENAGEAHDDPRAMNRSTNFDPESKHKLDRSKSLD